MAVKTLRKISSLRTPKVEYVTDNKGKKTKVILPIDEYENLLEDLHDLAVIAQRKHEKLIPFEEVVKALKRNGNL